MNLKSRILIGIVVLLTITSLQYYYVVNAEGTYLEDFLENIAEHEGEERSVEGFIVSMEENTFTLRTAASPIKVINSCGLEEIEYGAFLLEVQNAELICKDYRLYKRHYLKYVISFFAVIIVFLVLLKELKFTKRGFDYA